MHVVRQWSGSFEMDTALCLAGNAVAVHDIEAALYGSTLGMKADGTGAAGHACHMRNINEVKRRVQSIIW